MGTSNQRNLKHLEGIAKDGVADCTAWYDKLSITLEIKYHDKSCEDNSRLDIPKLIRYSFAFRDKRQQKLYELKINKILMEYAIPSFIIHNL